MNIKTIEVVKDLRPKLINLDRAKGVAINKPLNKHATCDNLMNLLDYAKSNSADN
jgi:hypothetical protein